MSHKRNDIFLKYAFRLFKFLFQANVLFLYTPENIPKPGVIWYIPRASKGSIGLKIRT